MRAYIKDAVITSPPGLLELMFDMYCPACETSHLNYRAKVKGLNGNMRVDCPKCDTPYIVHYRINLKVGMRARGYDLFKEAGLMMGAQKRPARRKTKR